MQFMDYEEFMSDLRIRNMASLYANIPGQESTVEEIYTALKQTEEYNQKLYEKTDKLLDYNDEIVEIVELDDGETMDISVAGDQLFYANEVLTKNSAGLVHTADFMLGVIETEELAQQGLQLIKQLKSRYGDKMINNKFNLIVKKGNQRWVEPDGQAAPKIPDGDSKTDEMFDKKYSQTNDIQRVKSPDRSELDQFVNDIKF